MVSTKRSSIFVKILPCHHIFILISWRIFTFSMTRQQIVSRIIYKWLFIWNQTIISWNRNIFGVNLFQNICKLTLKNISIMLFNLVLIQQYSILKIYILVFLFSFQVYQIKCKYLNEWAICYNHERYDITDQLQGKEA